MTFNRFGLERNGATTYIDALIGDGFTFFIVGRKFRPIEASAGKVPSRCEICGFIPKTNPRINKLPWARRELGFCQTGDGAQRKEKCCCHSESAS